MSLFEKDCLIIGVNSRLGIVVAIIMLLLPVSCGPLTEDDEAVDYTPLAGDDWQVSTPAEQGLESTLLEDLYQEAAESETLYGLLVVKNGQLIAEGYFNEGSVKQLSGRQSATKSYTSALVGIALEQGCLASLDQKMMEFLPEFAGQIKDPRKEQITLRDLLQMRAGYPDEESTPPYLDILFFSDNWHWLPHLVDFPLVSDPGTEFHYSSLTAHLLGVIVARACETDLKSFAQANLFSPIGAEIGDWKADADGYYWGWGELFVTARDMAKFGLLYLNDGEYAGKQVVSAGWIRDSLQRYPEGTDNAGSLPGAASRYSSFHDLGYGYQWWSASAGGHHFNCALGHGGQLIMLLDDLDMVIVATADPLYVTLAEEGWEYESVIVNLVGDFISALPEG